MGWQKSNEIICISNVIFPCFWTAEALLECYRITGCFDYLKLGQRVLDEMLMTQASWQPIVYICKWSRRVWSHEY